MQSKTEQAGERTAATVAIIKRAIEARVCLSGKHVAFRVRFAPHALGRDKLGRPIVFAFEYGGMTLGQAHWMWLAVHRLRDLQPTVDPWRSGSLESRPQFEPSEIEAAVDDTWTFAKVRPNRNDNLRGERAVEAVTTPEKKKTV